MYYYLARAENFMMGQSHVAYIRDQAASELHRWLNISQSSDVETWASESVGLVLPGEQELVSEYHEETAVAGAELWSWLAAAPLSRAGPAPRSHQLQLQRGMILTFSSACRNNSQDFSPPLSVLRLSAGLTSNSPE